MDTTVELAGIQTSLKNQKPFWQDILLISTSLLIINGVDQNELNVKLTEGQKLKTITGTSSVENGIPLLTSGSNLLFNGTTINFSSDTFSFANTTALNVEEDFTDDDHYIKPIFTNEFKIQIASIIIDKSLPKIFEE
jgi:hypothetical protein